MSFFIARQQAAKAAIKPRGAPLGGGRGVQQAAALTRLGCAGCPLNKAPVITPKMAPTLKKGAKIYFLGEGPGRVEDESTGKPFTGQSGQLLRSCIPDDIDCSFDNVVNCRTSTTNRDPEWNEVQCCHPRRVKYIQEAKPLLIVGLGMVPLHAVLGSHDLQGMRGRLFAVQFGDHKCWFLPTYHPSFVLRVAKNKRKPLNSMMGHCFRMDLKRAFEYAEWLGPPQILTEKELRANVQTFDGSSDTHLGQVLALLEQAGKAKEKAIDIETKGLRPYKPDAAIMSAAFSFGNVNFSFALDHPKAGWSAAQKRTLKKALKAAVSTDTIKIAHNVPFEVEWFIWYLGREIIQHHNWHCTQMECHFLDERRGKAKSTEEQDRRAAYQALKFLTKQHFGLDHKSIFKLDKKDMSKSDLGETLIYNCLMKGTTVITNKGPLQIEDLVKQKDKTIKTLSMNETTGKPVWASVTGWHKTLAVDQKWLQIKTRRKNVIRCTPDHKIITVTGRKEATDVKIGDRIYINEKIFSPQYMSALAGTLLGDSCILRSRNAAYVQGSNISKNLIDLKQRLLGGKKKDIIGGGYKPGPAFRWWLPCSEQFLDLHVKTYKRGKKYAAPLLKLLNTPQGIALWYMDDGFRQRRKHSSETCCFAIQGFADKEIIEKWIKKKYGNCKTDCNGTLRLGVEASKALCKEISPYIIESSRYKLPYHANAPLIEDKITKELETFYASPVKQIVEYNPLTRKGRGYKNVRYCLTVPTTGNFMTVGGLVSNCADTLVTLMLHKWQSKLLKHFGLYEAYLEALPRQTSAAMMQFLGVHVDQKEVKKAQNRLKPEIKQLEADIAGLKVVKAYVKDHKEFNPGSQDHVVEIFKDYLKRPEVEIKQERYEAHDFNKSSVSKKRYDDGKGTRYSVDKNVLDQINHPLAGLIVTWRNRTKLKSTYIDEFELGKGGLIYPDGLIHCNFNMTFAETGRTSSDDPNMQNFPKRQDEWVRNQVAAPDGHVLVAFDFGQLEGCTAAMCSKDKTMVKALWEDYDFHYEWGEKLAYAYPEIIGGREYLKDKDRLKKLRSKAKNKLVFPAIFGAQNSSIAGYLDMPEEIIEDLMDEFWKTFYGLADWQDKLMKNYYNTGYVESPTGRRRHYPMTRNQAINDPIQSVACDIVCRGMNTLSELAAEEQAWHLHPIMNIHDDLTLCMPDDDKLLEQAIEDVYRVMLTPGYDFINVPLSVTGSIGKHWYQMQEIGKFWSNKDL